MTETPHEPRNVPRATDAAPVIGMLEPETLSGLRWCVFCKVLQAGQVDYCRKCHRPLK